MNSTIMVMGVEVAIWSKQVLSNHVLEPRDKELSNGTFPWLEVP